MYIRTIFIILILTLSSIIHAGNDADYLLNIPSSYSVEEYKNDLRNWKQSLTKNIGYKEASITQEIFLRTDIKLVINKNSIDGEVYQSRNDKNRYFVAASRTIIDFNRSLVGSMGVSGITAHRTPSKRMVIILAPQVKTNLLGVTLDFTVKTQVPRPAFNNKSVKYQWSARNNG